MRFEIMVLANNSVAHYPRDYAYRLLIARAVAKFCNFNLFEE